MLYWWGDIVILKDDTSRRMYWKLALLYLVEGRDEQIRAPLVKIVDSDGKYAKLYQSLKHLR